MSHVIEISETVYTLEVETSVANIIDNIEIDSSSNQILEISSDYSVGLVYAGDVIGLDTYLSNFIDSYEIDCGSP